MKTIVACATIFCLDFVSSYPFPEPLPGYYGTYEQVPQQIQIPNISRSPDLYHQQQLAYIQQQDEKRRQNYENLLRNQNLNQRLSSQLLQRPGYNIQPVLNTVHEPYANSIPLQGPIQEARYEAPITQQYYPAQNVQQSIRQYQPVQSQQYEETRPEAAGTQAVHQINNPYSQPHYPGYNVRNLAYHPRIQQVLATTPLKKRYLVLHPNGTIEHIDKIEHIVEQHPNYILVNAGNVAPKPNEPVATAQSPVYNQQSVASVVPATPTAQANPVPASLTPALVAPVAPVVPARPSAHINPVPLVPNSPGASATAVPQANAVPESSTPSPVAPVAPVAKPATPSAKVNPVPSPVAPIVPVAPVAPATSANASPTPASAVAQANADPASPVTSPAPVTSAPVAPVALAVPPTPAPTSVAPVLPSIQYGTVPGSKPTVPPPTGPTTALPPVSVPTAQPPVIQNGTVPDPKSTVPPPTGPTTALPPVSAPTAQPPVILNGTVPGPTTVPPTTTVTPTTQPPIWVTTTATAVYPPPTTPLPPTTPSPTVTPVPPTGTTAPPVVGPVTPLPPTATPIPPVTATATAIATSAPAVTATPASATEAPDSLTTVAPYTKPSDPTDLDLLQVNTGTEPVVWFRTMDLDFWKKLTSGKEVYDIVYFFNVPREPRVMKDTKTTIHADGTVVEEITQTIYDDEDDETPPRVIKTTTITKPDGTQTKT